MKQTKHLLVFVAMMIITLVMVSSKDFVAYAADEKVVEVSTYEELKAAVEDESVNHIIVTESIDVPCDTIADARVIGGTRTAQLHITHDLIIEGKSRDIVIKRTSSSSTLDNRMSLFEIHGPEAEVTFFNITLDGGAEENISGRSMIDICAYGILNVENTTIQNGWTKNSISSHALDKGSYKYGGGIRVDSFSGTGGLKGGTINLKVGAIIQNCAASSAKNKVSGDGVGGGIGVYNYSSVNMYGGIIRNCHAKYGGGIGGTCRNGREKETPPMIKIYGGTIENCTAGDGGAFYLSGYTGSENVRSDIFGLIINNCKATNKSMIYVNNKYSFGLDKDVVIDGVALNNSEAINKAKTDGIVSSGSNVVLESVASNTVSFVNRGELYVSIPVNDGKSLGDAFPSDLPGFGDHEFIGWYTINNKGLDDKKINADTIISEGMTVYARYSGHTGGSATCVSMALCDVCGDTYGTFDANNHTNTVIKNKVAVTCIKDGYTGDTYCNSCGKTVKRGEIINKTGHDFTNYNETSPATCETDQVKQAVCNNGCGKIDILNVEGSRTGHVEIEIINAKEATCIEKGFTGDIKCLKCQKIIENGVEIPQLTIHTPGEPVKEDFVDATCETDGKYKDVTRCQVCNKIIAFSEKTIDKYGHQYVNGMCTKCQGMWGETIDGVSYKLALIDDENGNLVSELVNIGDSNEQGVAILVTAVDAELKGKVVIPSTIAVNESEQLFVVTSIVSDSFTSNEISEITIPETIEKLGDNSISGAANIVFEGKNPPAGIKAAINPDAIVFVQEGALESYREVLGDEFNIQEVHVHRFATEFTYDAENHWNAALCDHTDVITKVPHTFGEWVVKTEATEDATGTKERVCVCGYKETAETDKLPHEVHIKNQSKKTDPTCTTSGSIVYSCEKCGSVMETVEIPATGHVWDSGVVTKSPKIETDGEKTFTCTKCDATKTEAADFFDVYEKVEVPVSGKYDLMPVIKKLLEDADNTNASIDKITVSKKKNATVSKKGLLTAKKEGELEVIAYTKTGKKRYDELVRFTLVIKKTKFEKKATINGLDQTINFQDMLSNVPAGYKVTFSMKDKMKKYADLNTETGVLTPVAKGKVTVVCTIGEEKNAVKYNCVVKIKAAAN